MPGKLYDKIVGYSEYCPRLFTMLQKGIGYCESKIQLNSDISCAPLGHYFIRAYRYEGFKTDFMLAQQFNFEYMIMNEAKKAQCKHIVQMLDIKLSDSSTFFVL